LANNIIFTNGCFDVLHYGHFRLLEFCKSLGDYVIVGLNSDASVRRLKGDNRPINSQEVREFNLRCIKFVDSVIIFDEDTPLKLIEKIKPNYIVKGGDYTPKDVVGNQISEVIIFDYVNGFSTTEQLQHSTVG
tara:strand:+ start:100 stop:498 length:399 start_codon:yes stop_codon:yes gene_type:complete